MSTPTTNNPATPATATPAGVNAADAHHPAFQNQDQPDIGEDPSQTGGEGETESLSFIEQAYNNLTDDGVVEVGPPGATEDDPLGFAAADAAAPVQPTVAQPVAATPASPTVVTAPTAQPQQVTAPVLPVTGQPVQGQPTAPVVAAPVDTRNGFERILTAVREQRGAFEKQLEDKVYQLSEQDVAALNENPAAAIPKLISRAHVNIVEGVMGAVVQQLPAVMIGMLQAQRANDAAEEQFYGTFNTIDRANPTHMQTVNQISQMFRQMNPTVDTPTAIRMIGIQACMALGLPLPTLQAPVASTPQQPQVQTQNRAPVRRTPGPVVRTAPGAFVPAGTGAAPAGNNGAQVPNQWARAFDIIAATEAGQLDNMG